MERRPGVFQASLINTGLKAVPFNPDSTPESSGEWVYVREWERGEGGGRKERVKEERRGREEGNEERKKT